MEFSVNTDVQIGSGTITSQEKLETSNTADNSAILMNADSENSVDSILANKKLDNVRTILAESSDEESNENIVKHREKSARIIDSENSDSEESNPESFADTSMSVNEQSRDISERSKYRNHEDILKKFAESESSDDEALNNNEGDVKSQDENSDSNEDEIPLPKDRSNKVQRKSAKQAEENMLLIQSESQKFFREASIKVPYHKPRQCNNLKEFLDRKNIRRPSIIIGQKHKPRINMRGEELLRYAKQLEERAKEAELFFQPNLLKKCDDLKDDQNNKLLQNADQANDDINLNIEIIGNDKAAPPANNYIETDTTTLPLIGQMSTDQIIEPPSKTDQIIQPIREENCEEITNSLNIEICESVANEIVEIVSEHNALSHADTIPSTATQAEEMHLNVEHLYKKENEGNERVPLHKNAFQKLSDSEDDDFLILGCDRILQNVDNPPPSEHIPRLSGCPGMVIDLEENRVISQDVGHFMQRFVKHAKIKPAVGKHIIRGATEDKADGIVVVNHDEMEANKTNLVPGLALQKLRNELQFRMAQRRSEEFNKRLKQQKVEKTGYESDILDDKLHENEDELELELSSSEDEIESEVEKNNTEKEILVEDLADVAESQEEEEEEKIETSGKEQNEEELEYDEDAHVSEADDENSESENSSDSESENNENCMNKNDDTSKKIRKRIQVMNSSDSEVENEVEEDSKKRESIDLFQTQNEDEIIPLHQTKLAEPQTTPQYKCHNSSKDSELKLSSPTWLTENTQMTPIPQIISDTQCSIASADNQAQNSSAVKRLFLESTESTQHNNPFLSTQNELASLKCAEDELLELCSGQFPTQVSSKQNENNDTEEPQSNIKLCLSDENSISDVLNTVENNEVIGEKKLKRKKKKITTKPLQFSDDEESDEENDEENDFEDEEIEDVMQEEAEKIYEYDSEENEVEIIADKKKQQKYVEREFFENEAELSDSEWGSADEDERGLDIYDKELGDEDHIDTIKVRGELERIHMRQVLDEDKRDVRILQEMLLEDGENHGDATRERKFRWKNAGEGFSLDEKTEDQKTDEQVSEDEDQTEWRKNRFEREKVLREKQMQIEEISDSSTLLTDTLLSETLSEKKTKLTVRKPILEQVVTVGKEECFFSMGSALKSNRGSFLKRDEATLSRLSALTKINVDDPDGSRNLGSSGKGNFVFATLSPAPEKLSIEEKTKKRAPTEDLSSISKKVKKTTVNKKLLLDFLE